MNPHRMLTLGNGRRVYQRYRGQDPFLRDSGKPEAWETVELDAQGDPHAYRVSDDIHMGFSHDGTVLLSIAGVNFAIPDEQLGDFAVLFAQVRTDARARRKEYEREVAAVGS